MTPEEIAAKEAATAAAEKEAADAKAKAEAEANSHEDPVEQELKKVREKGSGKTELEKALFTKQQIEKRIVELSKESGIEEPIGEDDNAPVTVGMLRQREKEAAAKTSLQLADTIEDENERELVKHHLANTIRPSGNPQEDLKNARSMVNAVKNRQLIEEAQRKTAAKTHSSGNGAPPKLSEGTFEPTAEEISFMRAPFNMTQADIIAARKKAQQ